MSRKFLHTVTLVLCVSLAIVFSLGTAGEAAAKTTIKAISAWGKNKAPLLPYVNIFETCVPPFPDRFRL